MLLYALTIVVSAFLLFQVQPVIAKIILPWFGGSAAVWTTCLLFFQAVLLLGYIYAHGLIRYLKPRAQTLVHAGLLLASALVLPIIPREAWKPAGGEDPTFRILGLLAATVGLPYFLLSTTGPLLQAWYSRRNRGAMPYRLYALSNAGSMFALLSYPVLFEPFNTTSQQAVTWSFGYAAFIALCGLTALRSGQPAEAGVAEADDAPARPGAGTFLIWMALPACASALLLAVSNHLAQNVAAIPFLWVLPLSIYLLTFILCFEGSGWYRRNPYLQLLALGIGSMAYAMSRDAENLPVKILAPLFCMGLFTCCMVCHGEMARLKPHPRYLTYFYVMMSAGGAAGGLFVGFLAPKAFNWYYELPIVLVACAFLTMIVLRRDPEATWFHSWRQPAPLTAGILALALAGYLAFDVRQSTKDSLVMVRNFYGGLRVKDSGTPTSLDSTRSLTHGTINHGEQFLNPTRRDLPTTYYGPDSGVGIAIRAKQKTGRIRVGVIGLGTGTLSSYGRGGDYYRFYEINPLVIGLARKEFTFLGDCKAQVEVALGDARLSLEREAAENFDVLAVDAFSSDSIPVHLLTREAMSLYFRHLKPDGVLAVHISNRYLDLAPVLEGERKALGKVALLVDNEDDDEIDVFGSTWVLLASRTEVFAPAEYKAAEPLKAGRSVRLWTDEYSNLFQILK